MATPNRIHEGYGGGFAGRSAAGILSPLYGHLDALLAGTEVGLPVDRTRKEKK